MFRKLSALVLPVLVSMVAVGSLSAQATFGPGPAPEAGNPQSSIWGGIGLWKTLSADTPPAKAWGSSGWIDRINREPGQLTITETGTSVFYSFTDRFEMMVRVNVNERILSRRSDELSLGQATLNATNFAACTGCPIMGPPVSVPGLAINQLRNPIYNTLTGQAGYFALYPYINRRQQTGVGDVVVGASYNLASQSRGDKVSVAIHPWLSIPTHHTSATLFATGDQTGTFYGGVDLLVSAKVGRAGLYVNEGYEFLPAVKTNGVELIGATHVMPFRAGFNIPRTSKLQFIMETTADVFLHEDTPNAYVNYNPVDLTAGFRAYVRSYLALNAGYRRPLNQGGGDKNGFYFSVSTSNYPVAPAPPLPLAPTLTCSADPSRAVVGSPVRLVAVASTTGGGGLVYAWSTMAGTLENGNQAEARLNTTGLKAGDYTATVRVNDSFGGFTDCTANFSVFEAPKRPPTATCSVSARSVNRGESVTFTVDGNSPDGRPLTYRWSGAVNGTGRTTRLDTTSLSAGSYTGTVRVSDDRGLTADCSASTMVNVPAAPVVPKSQLLNTCSFTGKSNKLRPARVDNTCKAILDDAALRLQQQGDAALVVTGNSTADEATKAKKAAGKKTPADLGAQRAANVKDYLVTEKGVAAGRIEVRSASGGAAEATLTLVPRGATYDGPGAAVTEPKPQPRNAKKPAAKKAAASAPAAEKAPASADAKKAAPAADDKKAAAKKSDKKAADKKDDKKSDDKK
jgi:hypothetical protein